MLNSTLMPGICAGWTEDHLLGILEAGAKAKGEDPTHMKPFLETMKKVWGVGVDFSGKFAYTEIFCKMFGDNAFLGALERLEEVCADQPTYHYLLDVRTKPFCYDF